MSSELKTIGDRLRWYREERLRMSQRDFAREIEVSSPFITRVEGNKQAASANLLAKIQDRFGLSIDWLRSGRGEPTGDRQAIPEQRPLHVSYEHRPGLPDHEADATVAKILGRERPPLKRMPKGGPVPILRDSCSSPGPEVREASPQYGKTYGGIPLPSRFGYVELEDNEQKLQERALQDRAIQGTNLLRLLTDQRVLNRIGGLYGWQFEELRELFAVEGDMAVEDYEALIKYQVMLWQRGVIGPKWGKE